MWHPFRSPSTYVATAAVLLVGAISGFFYAWLCSTMWGLDAADPRVAILAMQAMNDSVRNAVFFPAFFLTPVVLGVAALLALREGKRWAAVLLGSAALVYLVGGIGVTGLINVPLNEGLAVTDIPDDPSEAARFWSDYSQPWQTANMVRTIASFASFALASAALVLIGYGPGGRQREAADAYRISR